jgi:hypothetical protein
VCLKVLVIIACSQRKANGPAAAKDLYLGTLFRLGREFAETCGYDYRILSAKYGLLDPEELIEPYDVRVAGVQDVKRLQQKVLPAMNALLPNYNKVIIIGGAMYRRILAPLMGASDKFEVITDSRGIGGILQTLRSRIVNKC